MAAAGRIRQPYNAGSYERQDTMRRILLAAASLIACACLAGCDQPGNTTAAAPPACDNRTAAVPAKPAATAPAVHRRHYRRQSFAGYPGQNVYSGSAENNGETQVSENSTTQTYENGNAPAAENGQAAVWTDGYGRQHRGGPALAAASPESRERRDPWRGYDVRCGEGDK